MNITQLEQEIVKTIELENKDLKRILEEKRFSDIDDLTGIIILIKQCFKDHKKYLKENI
tara:strand:- start:1 stop:177 length:177 start_codon:yes stop_codon:yes gene_type:complete